jgi:outer membrane receptor for ferrienterochelin and colicins
MGDGSDGIIARKYMNMEDAKTYGADFNLSYKLTSELILGGNYSYLDTKAHVYNSEYETLDEVTIDGMAHHKWNASMTWNHRFTPTYRIGVNFSTRGSSKRFYQNNGNGKAFQIWRLNTTHDFGRAEKSISYRVELGIDNIFNYVDRTMHPYHLGTTSAGTTLYASFSIKFRQGKKINTLTKKQNNYDEE